MCDANNESDQQQCTGWIEMGIRARKCPGSKKTTFHSYANPDEEEDDQRTRHRRRIQGGAASSSSMGPAASPALDPDEIRKEHYKALLDKYVNATEHKKRELVSRE